jgi:hypothetical protein
MIKKMMCIIGLIAILLTLISSLVAGMQVKIPIGDYDVSFEIDDSIADNEIQKFDFDTLYSDGYEDNIEITNLYLEKQHDNFAENVGTISITYHEIVTALADRESMLKGIQEYMKAHGWTDIKPSRRQIAGKDATVVMATDKEGELRDMTQFWFKIDKHRELVGTLYFIGNNATKVLDSFKLIPVQIQKENTTQKLIELRENATKLQAQVTPAYDKYQRGVISVNAYSNIFDDAKWAVSEYNSYLEEHFGKSNETMVFHGPKTKRDENGTLVVDLT